MSDTHATGKEKFRGHAAMALFALLIAASFSLGDRAVEHMAPGALNAVRFFFGAALMGSVAFALTPRADRKSFFRPKAAWRYLTLGALMGVYFVLMFVALSMSDPVSTGAVFTLMPFMSAGFGFLFLRQTSGRIVLASLAVAAAGAIWVIFRGDLEALLAFDVGTGEIIFFFGVAAHGAYAPLVKKFNRGEPVTVFTFWTLVGTFLCVTIYAAPELFAVEWGALPAIVWITIGYLALFTTAGTFFLLQYAAMRIPAGKAIAYSYMTPTYIILIEGASGAGWANASIMAGAVVTVLGLVILVIAPDV